MRIQEQLKSALAFHYVEKAFNTFYPKLTFIGDENAPNDFKGLKAFSGALSGEMALPVFTGGCDQTIYEYPWQNLVFRAWHDAIHIEKDFSSSYQNEIKTANEHLRQLQLLKAPSHVLWAVWYDVAGQVEYYYKHGKFVQNQRAFVQDCLCIGLESAIIKDYDTATSY